MAVLTLIIDDSAAARKTIRHRLEQIGCRVVSEAGDGAQGVKLFHELKPQLIALELVMPGGRERRRSRGFPNNEKGGLQSGDPGRDPVRKNKPRDHGPGRCVGVSHQAVQHIFLQASAGAAAACLPGIGGALSEGLLMGGRSLPP